MTSRKELEDPLIHLRTESERQRKRYEQIPAEDYLLDYHNRLVTGQPIPPHNAPTRTLKALTVQTPIRTQAGYLEYPYFTQRDDEYALKGLNRSLYDCMRHISTEALLNTKGDILLLVAPSGAGKSTLIKSISHGLEEYTDKTEPPPVFAIAGCPVNEDPLHILDEKTREEWKNKYGIKITGELCPHCFLESQKRGALGFKVKALQFSHKTRTGITKIEPKLSKYLPDYMPEIQQAILGSNRGLLHIAEFAHHPPDFINTLHDLFRGRLHSAVERERAGYEISNLGKIFEYELDTLIIGDMTTKEWEAYEKNDSAISVRERIDVVNITYPLTPTAQLDILKKHILNHVERPPHFSPNSLESVSSFGVRTRYRKPSNSKLTEAQKAALYDGKDMGELNQHRKTIETEGKAAKEGLVGISPPSLWKPVSKLIGDIISIVEEAEETSTKHRACFDFVEFRKKLEEEKYIDQVSTLSSDDKSQAKKQLQEVVVEYDSWLLKTVEEAFYDDFANRANIKLHEYLDEIDLYLNKDKVRKDSYTGDVIPVDSKTLEQIENAFATATKIELTAAETPNKVTRHSFRFNFQQKEKNIVTAKSTPPNVYRVTFEDFPEYRSGFMLAISTTSHDSKTKQILPLDILKMKPPIPELQSKEIELMKERLVQDYGFCDSCKDKLVLHISNQAKKEEYLKILLA